MDVLAAIAEERAELIEALDGLTSDQWSTPSCCDDWSVQDVAAHLTQGWNYSTTQGMVHMIKARGDLGRMSVACTAPLSAAGPEAIVADMRANVAHPFKPPGFGHESPLSDLVVHRRDICLPLGIAYEADPARVRIALDLGVAGGKLKMVNASAKLGGLRFVANDLEWSHGDGSEVRGEALPLAHAIWGRAQSLDELSGAGVDILRQRLG